MQRICAVDGCGKPVDSHGYCPAHASRFRRHGDPHGGRVTPGLPRHFLETIALPFDGDDCLVWPFNRSRGGYAAIRDGKRIVFVSHVLCEARNGPRPGPNYEVAHTCGRGHDGCVNPRHVRWATHADNCADKAAHGTWQGGERNPAAVLDEDSVRAIMALRGTATAATIAARFGISRETVSHIHNGRKWAHLFK